MSPISKDVNPHFKLIRVEKGKCGDANSMRIFANGEGNALALWTSSMLLETNGKQGPPVSNFWLSHMFI